ncbi:MAG: dTMP kinase, partial [Synechococcaceae cyanobacterium SM2_3_1]|nr:dTMP kinase [Synechococcaceae cyanobacterium SM2_3_1]
MRQSHPGHLITLEGGEGAGKTTQQRLLAASLSAHGYTCLTTREPGGTEVGQALRHLLLEAFPAGLSPRTELFLFAADRAEHVETMIRPALQRGSIVICDRFTDSTLVYQGMGRGIEPELIRQINQMATQGLQPDLTLWLNLPPEIGLARVQERRRTLDQMEQQDLHFHDRLHQGFAQLAAAEPRRIREVNALRPIEMIAAEIENIVIR